MSEAANRSVTDRELLAAIDAAADEPSGINGLPTTGDVADSIGLSTDQVRKRAHKLEARGHVTLHESTAFQGASNVTTTLTIDPDGGDQATLEVDG